METLAVELNREIDNICVEYHYMKSMDVMDRAKTLADNISQFTSGLLQGNVFGIEEEEYLGFQEYVVQVLRDYAESVKQCDVVLMIDTLDYGLRELLNIFIDADAGEKRDE